GYRGGNDPKNGKTGRTAQGAQSTPVMGVRNCVRKQKKRPFEGPLFLAFISNLLIRNNFFWWCSPTIISTTSEDRLYGPSLRLS
ncbi:MAG: hypothetical protein Q7K57_22735, partial [Burkholderiaceae bacterium]|nr:hypothetical protein [Burkholderiaceae bacterium]